MYCACIGTEIVNTKLQQLCKNTTTAVDDNKSHIVTGSIKPVYPVLVGDYVRAYPTNLFASLPQHDKFLVKERLHDPTVGFTRAKLVLKSCVTEVEEKDSRFVNLRPCSRFYLRGPNFCKFCKESQANKF